MTSGIFGNKKSITFAKDYDEFKLYMSKKLEIHVNNIAIVGSAKMGFSLSPDKNYRTFNDESDIDLVLVSDRIYKSSRWHLLNYNQRIIFLYMLL